MSHQSMCSHDFCPNIRPFLLTICSPQQVISWYIICSFAFYLHCLYIILFCRGCLQRFLKGQEQWFEYFWILALRNDCHYAMYKYFKQRLTDCLFVFSNPLSVPFSDAAFRESKSHDTSLLRAHSGITPRSRYVNDSTLPKVTISHHPKLSLPFPLSTQ